jgi:predicted membrane protein
MNENSRISSVIVSVFCIGIIIFILFTQMEISTIKLKLKDASLILIFLALLVYINGYEKLFLVLLLLFVIFYFTPSEYTNRIMSYFTQKKSILKKVRVIEEKEQDKEQEPDEEYQQEEQYEELDSEETEIDDNYDTESQANTEITIDDDIENEDIQINKISQNNNND